MNWPLATLAVLIAVNLVLLAMNATTLRRLRHTEQRWKQLAWQAEVDRMCPALAEKAGDAVTIDRRDAVTRAAAHRRSDAEARRDAKTVPNIRG